MDEHEGFTPEERWVGAFLEGIQAAQAGARGLPNVIETKDGPVEGTPTPDGIRFDLPDGRVFEVWEDAEGGRRYVLDGTQVARTWPAEQLPPDDDV
jgi:hypothetical protein